MGLLCGGLLAALLGTSTDMLEIESNIPSLPNSGLVQVVVTLSGPTDLQRMGGEHDFPDSPESRLLGGPVQTQIAKARMANPINFVHRAMPPFLIVHGTQDETVPLFQAELLYQAIKRVGAKGILVPFPEENHALNAKGESSMILLQQTVLNFFTARLHKFG